MINGRAYDFFHDAELVREILAATAHLYFDRNNVRKAVTTMGRFLLAHPSLLIRGLRFALTLAWKAKRDLIAARGRVTKLSLFVHNFMGAAELDPQRIAACSFMVMTPEGPLSMCLHNAKRDHYLLLPAKIRIQNKLKYWDPVSGRLTEQLPTRFEVQLTRKNARGRAKQNIDAAVAAQ